MNEEDFAVTFKGKVYSFSIKIVFIQQRLRSLESENSS